MPDDIEQRVRQVIEGLERWGRETGGSGHPDPGADHWFTSGKGEAYDNVIDQLYWVLGEER